MALKEWKYQCQNTKCRHISLIRYRDDYKPYTHTMMTCVGCHKYSSHRLLAPNLLTRDDVRRNG